VSLANEKYAVPTPVWITPLKDGSMGFSTSSGSGKAKRLAHTSRVTVQPCNSRGKVTDGTEPTDATATTVTGSNLDEIRTKITAKYGFATKITKLLGAIGGIIKRNRIPYGDLGVVISIDS